MEAITTSRPRIAEHNDVDFFFELLSDLRRREADEIKARAAVEAQRKRLDLFVQSKTGSPLRLPSIKVN